MGGAKDGGPQKLWEELEAEKCGVHIPAEIRWLGGAKVRARFQKRREGISSAAVAVQGETTFNRLWRYGVRLFGARYDVDAHEEVRPNAFCSRYSGWGHIAPHCEAAAPKCSICAKDHEETTTCARLRGARWEEVACALTERPSAPTAEDLTGRGPTPALPRGRPGGRLGDGGHHPHCDG